MLGYKEAEFHVRLYTMWERESEKITRFTIKDKKMMWEQKNVIGEDDNGSDEEIATSDEEESENEDIEENGDFDGDMEL